MSDDTRVELHSHSTVSDGQYSPQRLAELMDEHHVDIWALTDHDTVDGCVTAAAEAQRRGIDFISGIEVSADLDGTSIHVLGYGVDIEDSDLKYYGRQMVDARRERMEEMVRRICDLGCEIAMDDVLQQSGSGNLGRPHLARALVERGHVEAIQEAFDRFLAREQPGYVALAQPAVPEAIDMITDAGGLVVLAHPARYGDISSHLQTWKDAGLWGLEVRHPSHDAVEEAGLIRLADQFGLGKTASNDWHGNKPEDVDRLGTVRFPRRWRSDFLDAVARGR